MLMPAGYAVSRDNGLGLAQLLAKPASGVCQDTVTTFTV
jgi:hypothetical protein